MSNTNTIIKAWESKKFKPVYWFEGEEVYYIDELINYAETSILPEAEASFNLSIFYGKDSSWADVVNACMKYPMFSDRQIVILKEAQQMKDLDLLSNYIQKPLHSTIFIVGHKNKALDARTSFAKLVKSATEYVKFEKVKDHKLPDVVKNLVQSRELSIGNKALMMLIEHIGSDLSRINNELDKVMVNMGGKKEITEELIEEFIGISKDYNVFELQRALGKKDIALSLKIVGYFESNPKSVNIHSVVPVLYGFFSKALSVSVASKTGGNIESETGIRGFLLSDYYETAKRYSTEQLEKVIILLNNFNLRSLGVNDPGSPQGSLMKELVMKIAMC